MLDSPSIFFISNNKAGSCDRMVAASPYDNGLTTFKKKLSRDEKLRLPTRRFLLSMRVGSDVSYLKMD